MLRILITDDNVDAANALSRLLIMSGFETRVAYDAENALLIASEFRPEIALLDIGMPGTSGLELCVALKRRHKGELIATFAISAWSAVGDVALAKEMGFDHHFTKPVEYEALEAAIRAYAPRVA